MLNGRTDRGAIVPVSHCMMGFSHSLAPLRNRSWPDRGDDDGEDERAQQREGDRPGHGLEEPAFDRLQREDGQIGSDDDAAGEEDRPLHFVRGLANLLRRRARVVRVREMADDVFDHHHGAVDDHAEVERAQREQIGGNVD